MYNVSMATDKIKKDSNFQVHILYRSQKLIYNNIKFLQQNLLCRMTCKKVINSFMDNPVLMHLLRSVFTAI